MIQIRECLHLSPEHKECFPFYKKIKKLLKLRQELEKSVQAERWMDCLEKAKSILRFEREVDPIQIDVYRHTCKCNVKVGSLGESREQGQIAWANTITRKIKCDEFFQILHYYSSN